MAIGAVGSGTYSQKAYSGVKDDAAQLKFQRGLLQRQLESLSSKSKNTLAEQEAAERQKEIIKRKIAEIDKRLQKLAQEKQQERHSPDMRELNPDRSESSGSVFEDENEIREISGTRSQYRGKEKSQNGMFKILGNYLDTYA